MRTYVLWLSIASLACAPQAECPHERLVREFIAASNAYDPRAADLYLSPEYRETYGEDGVEIEDAVQWRTQLGWARVMGSTTEVLSLTCAEGTVTTTQRYRNYMDTVLGRRPRQFRMTYLVRDERILSVQLDTLPGYYLTKRDANAGAVAFASFCERTGRDCHPAMDSTGGRSLRAALEAYRAGE